MDPKDIKLHDRVVITDSGKTHDTYRDWAEANNLSNWAIGELPEIGNEGIVVTCGSSNLIGVEIEGKTYIINRDGVKRVLRNNVVEGSPCWKAGIREDTVLLAKIGWEEFNKGDRLYIHLDDESNTPKVTSTNSIKRYYRLQDIDIQKEHPWIGKKFTRGGECLYTVKCVEGDSVTITWNGGSKDCFFRSYMEKQFKEDRWHWIDKPVVNETDVRVNDGKTPLLPPLQTTISTGTDYDLGIQDSISTVLNSTETKEEPTMKTLKNQVTITVPASAFVETTTTTYYGEIIDEKDEDKLFSLLARIEQDREHLKEINKTAKSVRVANKMSNLLIAHKRIVSLIDALPEE